MSLEVSPGGLSGLIVKIHDELQSGKELDEILSKYPVSKTALPYLLTLQEEYSQMLLDFIRDEYSPLEKENIALKEQIKRLESEKAFSDGVDITELKKKLERLEKENNDLKALIDDLTLDKQELESRCKDFEIFFSKSFFCSLLFRRYKDAN